MAETETMTQEQYTERRKYLMERMEYWREKAQSKLNTEGETQMCISEFQKQVSDLMRLDAQFVQQKVEEAVVGGAAILHATDKKTGKVYLN